MPLDEDGTDTLEERSVRFQELDLGPFDVDLEQVDRLVTEETPPLTGEIHDRHLDRPDLSPDRHERIESSRRRRGDMGWVQEEIRFRPEPMAPDESFDEMDILKPILTQV